MTRRAWAVRVAAAMASVVVVAALTGCVGAESRTRVFSASPDTSLRQPTDLPTGLAIDRSVRKHVTIDGCREDGSAWRANGRVGNPDPAPHSYDLTVFFTDPAGTVVAHASTTLTVPAGGSSTWAAEASNHTGGPLACVLTGLTQR